MVGAIRTKTNGPQRGVISICRERWSNRANNDETIARHKKVPSSSLLQQKLATQDASDRNNNNRRRRAMRNKCKRSDRRMVIGRAEQQYTTHRDANVCRSERERTRPNGVRRVRLRRRRAERRLLRCLREDGHFWTEAKSFGYEWNPAVRYTTQFKRNEPEPHHTARRHSSFKPKSTIVLCLRKERSGSLCLFVLCIRIHQCVRMRQLYMHSLVSRLTRKG